VRIKKKDNAQSTQGANASEHSQTAKDSALTAIVVEAEPRTFAEVPNDSVDAIHGLLAAALPLSSERLAATSLENLKPSPFYNMLSNGEPLDKALVLLKFTQRSNGKQLGDGFLLATDNVRDALDPSGASRYGTIACCSIEKTLDFTGAKDSFALAIVCKIVSPPKPQHVADLYLETMGSVDSVDTDQTMAMVKQLQRVSAVNDANASTSTEAAWQQRKRKRLQCYPMQM
jgi:hypothetical protein